jgi:signal transduction histidine kinase
VAIADEIARLNAAFYRQQYENVNRSEQRFRRDLGRTIYLVLVAGLIVASASILRIAWLEKKAREQHEDAQRTGAELRNLSTRLRHAQEEERKTISRELHDDVGQKLTALRMELGGLERLREGEQPQFRERLNEVKALAEQSLRTIRDIAAGLRPSVLDDLGLGPALQRQARKYANGTGTPVSVELAGELDNLPERHRIYIYRIVQESLTNCAKHANASRIAISLNGTVDRIMLKIEDNGVGFEPSRMALQGLGLVGIEERVRELNGSVTIESAAGAGTRLAVDLPVSGSRS